MNEYNIQEKIKEANQELFLEIKSQTSEDTVDEELPMSRPTNGNGRKVTFRPNLEEYEPDEEEDELLLLQSASSESSLESIPEQTEEVVEIHSESVVEDEMEEAVFETLNFLTIDPIGFEEQLSPKLPPPIRIIAPDQAKIEEGRIEPSIPENQHDVSLVVNKPKKKTAVTIKQPKEKPSPPQQLISNSLKYKYCCEQKKLNEALLPRYDGGINSEYGLSKKQLQVRRAHMERRRKYRQEVEFRKYQEQVERSRLNEEAFERWLRKKLASTPKKYVNRYDDNKARRK